MKKLTILFTALSVAMLSSCKDKDSLENGLLPEENQSSELSLSVNIDNQNGFTRSVVNSSLFPTGSEIGISVQNSLNASLATNLQCSTVDGTIWVLSSPVSLTEEDGNVDVYAYYPYSESVNDLTAIPVAVAAVQSGTSASDNQTDYMIGSATASKNASQANLTMHHALTEISFMFNNVSYSYLANTREGKITSVVLSNGNTVTPVLKSGSGLLNAKTGVLTTSQTTTSNLSLQADLCLFDESHQPLSEVNSANLLSYPINAVGSGDVVVSITIDGKAYSTSLPAVQNGFKAGSRYIYPINIKLIKPSADGTGYTDGNGNPADGNGNSLSSRQDANGNTIYDYTYADGSRVVDTEGNLLYPDGTKVSDDPANPGNHGVDETTTYSNGQKVLDEDGNMLYPDGTKVNPADPTPGIHTQYLTYEDGSPVTDPDGNLLYPDGTKVSDDPEHPENHLNGNTIYSNGQPILDGEGNMLYPDGTSVITSNGDKVGSDSAAGTIGKEQTEGHTGAGTSPDAENAVFVRISIGTVSITPWVENPQGDINLVIGEN